MITSVPHLMAIANGLDCLGPHRCFYCGAPTGEDHPASIHVKSSFTGRTGVVAPGSPWVCVGCILCLREDAEITMIDGTTRTGAMMRTYSWVITKDRALAASKANLAQLRAICLDPPEPPFALVLSDSGQTHQLYRGAVNHSRQHIIATLENEQVSFTEESLRSHLALCGHLIAATGKPALSAPMTQRFAMAVLGRYRDGEAMVNLWAKVREQPLSRLAAWLSPPKEECQREYPSNFPTQGEHESATAPNRGHRSPAAKTGGVGRPEPTGKNRGRGTGHVQGDSSGLLPGLV